MSSGGHWVSSGGHVLWGTLSVLWGMCPLRVRDPRPFRPLRAARPSEGGQGIRTMYGRTLPITHLELFQLYLPFILVWLSSEVFRDRIGVVP
eukprot:scaffold1137_cov392-Pavlova_lutheri.AAC.28